MSVKNIFKKLIGIKYCEARKDRILCLGNCGKCYKLKTREFEKFRNDMQEYTNNLLHKINFQEGILRMAMSHNDFNIAQLMIQKEDECTKLRKMLTGLMEKQINPPLYVIHKSAIIAQEATNEQPG